MAENFTRVSYPDREAWLKARMGAIGASDAPAVMQKSPWVSNVQLWEEKTGRRKPKDLSNNQAVQRGIREEPLIRAQFMREHPEYLVEYHQFEILFHKDYPFIAATLDAELTEIATGRRGVWECKTGSYSTPYYLDKWTQGYIPELYFPQVIQQLLVTGWDFLILRAKLFRIDASYSRGGNNSFLPETFETQFYVDAHTQTVIESKEAVLDADVAFWSCVVTDTMPWQSMRIGGPK